MLHVDEGGEGGGEGLDAVGEHANSINKLNFIFTGTGGLIPSKNKLKLVSCVKRKIDDVGLITYSER